MEKGKKVFWKKSWFWILGIAGVFVIISYFQNPTSFILLVLGAFIAGLLVQSVFNVGRHFLVVNLPKIMEKVKGKESYYGQFGQDKWIVEDVFDFKENGFFVELAAGNGVNKSNTYILEKKFNWKGICIEANDALFEKLKSNRNCVCINACIDDSVKKVKFTSEEGLTGGIINENTDNKDLVHSDKFVVKETIPLEDVFAKHDAPKIIDYFSLDVEGSEYNVLKNFPFDRYVFLAMNIERPNKELTSLLKNNGYIKVGSNPCDKLFINEKFAELQNSEPKINGETKE